MLLSFEEQTELIFTFCIALTSVMTSEVKGSCTSRLVLFVFAVLKFTLNQESCNVLIRYCPVKLMFVALEPSAG